MASLASLIEAEHGRLADALGAAPFAIAEAGDDHCRVVADGLTIHFYRRSRDGLIHSSVELASTPAHAVALSDHVHTWLLLKSRGEEWPDTQCSDALAAEIARLARALPALRNEATLVESLLWEAGYMVGYERWD